MCCALNFWFENKITNFFLTYNNPKGKSTYRVYKSSYLNQSLETWHIYGIWKKMGIWHEVSKYRVAHKSDWFLKVGVAFKWVKPCLQNVLCFNCFLSMAFLINGIWSHKYVFQNNSWILSKPWGHFFSLMSICYDSWRFSINRVFNHLIKWSKSKIDWDNNR